ncbi:protein-methionine-sulfoxide reductase catalytic subunit MsrP [Zavarzinia sp. CC-PAN008]|uniref:protein-methionine-sulfoxide reductase catalytic subunit MsrP n=1 Tax=Zavarzinia sp. CC-PAN008 TaxID=3243332 RepID=UPI003F74760E
MLIKVPRGWELPESAATPERLYLNRRALLGGMAAGSLLALGACDQAPPEPRSTDLAGAASGSSDAAVVDPSLKYYPAAKNPAYADAGRPVTAETLTSTYNNFYEFGTHKQVWSEAQALKIRPWQVKIDGMVEEEQLLDIDALFAKMPFEERIYRHRCVEAWSMVVPWTGFPLAKLVELAKPLSGAKYLRMETFMNPRMARGQQQSWYPWPYVEGLTMAEATHELAFLVTGVYGKPAAPQFGAPIRLHVPWKYGFKSVKSIVRFTFTESRPRSFWEELGPSEYGFWANVNPEVPHPRWSQASEEQLGGERIPTVIYNGYGEQVADLYKGLEGEALYM